MVLSYFEIAPGEVSRQLKFFWTQILQENKTQFTEGDCIRVAFQEFLRMPASTVISSSCLNEISG